MDEMDLTAAPQMHTAFLVQWFQVWLADRDGICHDGSDSKGG